MADNTEVFSAKLDNEDFKKKAKECIESLEKIGDVESLGELIKKIGTASKLLGTMAVAFYAVKASIEFVEEAEEIRQINNEFELLTKNAHISSSALKEGLEKSAKGLIDNTDLLKISNKAIVEMGNAAKRLPEVMELARKSTSVFGGELAQNFEAISSAISNGNVKALKHMGIIVDADKAYKKYAISIGETVGSLSQAGRQQALMNEVLAKGGESFKNISGDGAKTKNTLREIVVALGDIKEAFIVAFEKVAGPAVAAVLGKVKEFALFLKDKAVVASDELGASQEGVAAKLRLVQGELDNKKKLLAEISAQEAAYGKVTEGYASVNKEQLEATIKGLVDQKHALQEKTKAFEESAEAEAKAMEGPGGESSVDPEKKKAQQAQFSRDLLKIKEDELNSRQAMEEGVEVFEGNLRQQRRLEEEQLSNRIDEIHAKAAAGAITGEQATQLIETEKQAAMLKTASLEESLTDRKIKALERLAERSKDTSKSIAAGWQAASMKSQEALKKSSNIGAVAYGSLSKHGKSAFEALGNGSKTAGEAMRGFLLGSIADIAEAQGEYLLAAGIGTYNPLMIAEGGALIALSSLLRSQAGGASSGLGGGASGGGGDSAGATSSAQIATDEDKPNAAAQEKKHVNVTILHNFDTEQTRQRLAEFLREQQDATDFKFQDRIGV